ncbi:MAG: lactate permease LctP family transporter [Dechloromonas sp.]|uniref:L-lactate permease n=1 Tax=Candidatus Dechloromonas phosphorivorans TaxID=2899244 RepID=A0A9D7LTT9_9RHOO|nr:lactate permease LctP family transporter [Candidatus Dechloromonas phosphorivorans]
MTWQMNVDPLGNIGLSALVAAIPILFLFWALAIKRMKGHFAAMGGTGLAVLIAVLVFKMPVDLAALATLYGGAFGLFPVCWIVITALFIYNMSVKTGQFEVIKNSLASISDDRRLQALLIAFSFGAFIEGAAGFGTPVAITAAMLAGLGFNPLYAAGICLLANTAPVAWGAIGIPIVVGGQVSGIPDFALSQMVGRTLPIVSIFIPLYLVVLMAGWKKGLEVWPACLVSGGSFAIAQFFSANSPLTAPLLPDLVASITSIICTVAFLKIWHPKESWHFPDEPKSEGKAALRFTGGQIFRAWAPFIILSLFVCAWGIKPVNQALNQMTKLVFDYAIPIGGLDKMVIDQAGKAKPAVYNFNVLSAAGTAILFAWMFSVVVMGATVKTAIGVAGDTLKTLKWPIVTIATILGFAYIMNFSGMAIALGYAVATTGVAFPFFAAILGWLGVFMTGSDTSTNALFGKLQAVTAEKLGIDPVIALSANTSGGVCGKMISPQSISVATGATGMVGRESEIFRFTFKHSIFLAVIVGILHLLWAYVFPGVVPSYVKPVAAAAAAVSGAAAQIVVNPDGLMWLGIFVGIIAFVTFLSRVLGANLLAPAEGKDEVHFH